MARRTRADKEAFYDRLLFDAEWEGPRTLQSVMADLGRRDLYFLLTRLLGRQDIRNDWLYERCCDVQERPNGMLDLWAREHRKSTIITFALNIQDILNDQEITIGIFAFNKAIAKKFLYQIKEELQNNQKLKDLYPEILYQNPEKEAPLWSLDNGLVVKRKSNPKEPTIGGYGLTDGLPTGMHFHIRDYDDIIDEKNVTSVEMILKAIEKWELSLNLGSDRICPRYGVANIERYVGTRYKKNDPWAHIEKIGAAIPRIHPGTVDGTRDGASVYFSEELMTDKKKKMGRYTFACQILQDPKADALNTFREEDLMQWEPRDWGLMNRYIIVDPASKKKVNSDYTDIKVIGLASDRTYRWIDGINDRLSLKERAEWVFKYHRMYKPLAVGYEEYGQQADIEHIEDRMDQEQYHFIITPLGGKVAKEDRIQKLQPLFEDHRMWSPFKCLFTNYEGRTVDAVQVFKDQYEAYPVSGGFDDSLDNMARIIDPKLKAVFPTPERDVPRGKQDIQAVRDYDPFAELDVSLMQSEQAKANEYRPFGD